MREFFRGWRRKVGCVTLVMACGLMGLWIRSGLMAEEFETPIPLGPRFVSRDSNLEYWTLPLLEATTGGNWCAASPIG